jgi:hypothetical protein
MSTDIHAGPKDSAVHHGNSYAAQVQNFFSYVWPTRLSFFSVLTLYRPIPVQENCFLLCSAVPPALFDELARGAEIAECEKINIPPYTINGHQIYSGVMFERTIDGSLKYALILINLPKITQKAISQVINNLQPCNFIALNETNQEDSNRVVTPDSNPLDFNKNSYQLVLIPQKLVRYWEEDNCECIRTPSNKHDIVTFKTPLLLEDDELLLSVARKIPVVFCKITGSGNTFRSFGCLVRYLSHDPPEDFLQHLPKTKLALAKVGAANSLGQAATIVNQQWKNLGTQLIQRGVFASSQQDQSRGQQSTIIVLTTLHEYWKLLFNIKYKNSVFKRIELQSADFSPCTIQDLEELMSTNPHQKKSLVELIQLRKAIETGKWKFY